MIRATAALHDFSEISFRKKVGRGNEKRGAVASPAPLFSSCSYLPLIHSQQKRIMIRP
jgi:hypothetical protein